MNWGGVSGFFCCCFSIARRFWRTGCSGASPAASPSLWRHRYFIQIFSTVFTPNGGDFVRLKTNRDDGVQPKYDSFCVFLAVAHLKQNEKFVCWDQEVVKKLSRCLWKCVGLKVSFFTLTRIFNRIFYELFNCVFVKWSEEMKQMSYNLLGQIVVICELHAICVLRWNVCFFSLIQNIY